MQVFAAKHVRKMDEPGRFGADSMLFNSTTRLPHDLCVSVDEQRFRKLLSRNVSLPLGVGVSVRFSSFR